LVRKSNNKPFKWTIRNNQDFERSINALGRFTDDFRTPFRLIASDFYRSQKQLFNLKSEGLYNPLGGFNYNAMSGFGNQTKRERAEALKEKKTGHPWAPILFGETGDLKDSTLSKNHRYSIFFLGRKSLQIGTSVPYGKFHQSDAPRKTLPQRKFIFITGGPGDKSKDSRLYGRRERWKAIIQEHIKQIVTGKVK